MFRILVIVLLAVSRTFASECQTSYYGTCHSLFGSCESGQKSTLSHCGFLRKCCYSEHSHISGTISPITNSGQCGHPLVSTSDRIIGGSSVLSGEYPWQVSLRYEGQHLCGGTLIDRQWVLTAAHCFEDTSANGWTVAVGSIDLDTLYSSQVYRNKHIITHGQYDKVSNAYDIGMIKLEKPIDVTGKYARTACLPEKSEDFDRVACTVTGWGSTANDGPGSRFLRQVTIPVMSNSLCKYYLGNVVFDHNICAGINAGGKDACQGDSGGPLVCKSRGSWKLAGIVSWGYGCGDKNTPGVYTRVSSFLDWINKVKHDYQ